MAGHRADDDDKGATEVGGVDVVPAIGKLHDRCGRRHCHRRLHETEIINYDFFLCAYILCF